MSVKPGEILGAKYQVERVIGEGGMGLVVAARHMELGHLVAIKCLHASALGHEGAVIRFEREARAAATLTSEHVARVIDVGRFENGSPYMVMEFLEGEDLFSMLRREGALSIADTVRFASHAADGLGEAHAAGIIHRDVKPSNLFAARRKKGGSVIKVLDFGIAKTIGGTGEHGLTATQALIGSPQYMSPEQVRESRTLDARTDIWALGVTMYECLTGRKPFDAPGMVDLCFAIVQQPPASIIAQRQDVPPRLEAVIFKCLAKDPADRYASMGDLQQELVMILTHVSGEGDLVMSRMPGIPLSGDPSALSATVQVDGIETANALARTQGSLGGPKAERKTPAVWVAVVGLLVLGGLSMLFRGTDGVPQPASSVRAPEAVRAPEPVPPSANAAPAIEKSQAPAPSVDAGSLLADPSTIAARVPPVKVVAPVRPKPEPVTVQNRPPPPVPPSAPPAKGRGLDMTIE